MTAPPHVLHGAFAALTLGASAFVVFGPYRSRLPRILTRFAKFSMAAKLTALAVVSGLGVWKNIEDGGGEGLRWALGAACVGFAAAAAGVLLGGMAGRKGG